MKDNLAIWNAATPTDSARTKRFMRAGGFSGTAINPTYLMQRATELFGPAGSGWGWKIEREQYIEAAPIIDLSGVVLCREIIHVVLVTLWYQSEGEKRSIQHYGQTTFVGKQVKKGKNGEPISISAWTDEEAPKKSLTDAITKALSCLGFASDIHMGRWDDVKGVRPTPLGVTELKNKLRELSKEIRAAETLEELDLLLIGSKREMEECEQKLPLWYNGDGGDVRGLVSLVEEVRAKLSVRKVTPDFIQ